MNIHLMPAQKFTDKFLYFINQQFDLGSNLVYVYDSGDGFQCEKVDCAKYISDFEAIDLSVMGDHDKFFVHGFYEKRVIDYLSRNLKAFKKNQLVLIAWGADIYNNRLLLKSDHKPHLRVRLLEMKKKRLIGSSNIYMTFACADQEIIHDYYGGNGKQFDCLYPSNANIELLDTLKSEKNESVITRILLGNSATPTNLHFEALDAMKKFGNRDIEIVCPLSYGEKEYGEQVCQYGKKLFGDKFIPITDYMSPEDYSRLLNTVSIAVFNHNRQQGTGNIEILSYLGKKLFIRSDTTTWKHYVDRDKCRFFDAKEIGNMSFSDFVRFSEEDIAINERYFRKIWDIMYVKSLWEIVMNYN